jgi:hypothetical protein
MPIWEQKDRCRPALVLGQLKLGEPGLQGFPEID